MNKTKSNAFSIMLAIVLIALIWICVVAIAVLLTFIFDNEQFVLRCILIQPFSIGGVFSTRSVWKYYLQH